MSPEDQGGDDPFVDAADPEAVAREERRKERESRREQRDEKRRAREEAVPPSPPPPPDPPAPPRTPEEDFWEEEPEPAPTPPAPPPPAPSQPQRGPRPPRRGAGVLGALRRHPFRIAAAAVAIFLAWSLFSLFQPFHGDGSGREVVRIPKGASASEIGDLLDERGIVSDSTMFQIRVTIAGKRSDLYPGRFVLAHDMSYGDAIDALSTPPVKVTTSITIPEGYSRAQAAPLAAEAGLTGSYLKASRGHEGFLFPDTFEFKPHAPAADLVQLQLEDFGRRIKGVDMGYARSKNLTVHDVVTIASMVEREAGIPSQRKLVAAVIYNRLHDGMPLGIDATIRFATGNYTQPLTESELAIDSPYNTRTNAGLPPGPIDSPGLASIEAAAHPAKVGYLFYVTEPGACGRLAFAKTEAEFERDVERYNSAREAAGGNSPDTCGE